VTDWAGLFMFAGGVVLGVALLLLSDELDP